jgi:glycosyltransferase involved in cell wall biosynthesis
MTKGLTIIIPVFNEIENLDRVEEQLLAFINSATLPSKVLFVDDGSLDGSLFKIEEICNRNSAFNFIAFNTNYGLSAAIKAGFDTVETTLTGYIDADLQTDPKDFNVLLNYIEDYDLVTGTRTKRKDSLVKNTSSFIANTIRRLFTNDGMDDTGCPLKIIKTKTAQNMPMFKGLHRFLPAMVLLQKGTVKQVPISHFPRVAGQAKFGLWNRLISPLIDCFAYSWMKWKYINYTINKRG